MAVLLVVTGITFGMLVGIQQQNVNVQATINGARQAQLASTSLVQYLRAAVQIAATTPVTVTGTSPNLVYSVNTPPSTANATSQKLGVVTYTGDPTGGAAPTLVPVYATYTAGPVTRQQVGTGKLAVVFGFGTSTYTVKTFDILAPGANNPIFTYYEYTAPPYGSGNPEGTLHQLSSAALALATCLSNIVAVRLNITVLAGPGATPTRGYAADVASNVNTLIYLHNATYYGVPPTTSTAVGASNCYS